MIPLRLSGFLAKYGIWLGIAACMVLMLSVAYCVGQSAGKNKEIVKQQEQEIETQQDIGAAGEKASATRIEDAKRDIIQRRELSDALQATDDPARQRALRGCLIMQQQGQDTSHLPACR